jgi:hypothetical protein
MDIKVEGTYVTRLVSVLNLGHVVVLLVTGSGLRAGLVYHTSDQLTESISVTAAYGIAVLNGKVGRFTYKFPHAGWATCPSQKPPSKQSYISGEEVRVAEKKGRDGSNHRIVALLLDEHTDGTELRGIHNKYRS